VWFTCFMVVCLYVYVYVLVEWFDGCMDVWLCVLMYVRVYV